MKRVLTIFLLVSVMVALAGCETPLDTKKGSGLRIRVSSMSNEVSTKTQYTGEIVNKRERIDWKAGDKVRIFSEDITLVANATGVDAGGGYIYPSNDEEKYYHDYTIAGDGTPRDGERYKSDSSLQNEGEGKGLVWVNDPTSTATVYGIYPTGESIRTSDNRLRGFSGLTITAPGQNSLTWTSRSTTVEGVARTAKIGVPSDAYMQSAYMVAAPEKFVNKKDETTGASFPTVNLEFYPVFNAFEFELYGEKDTPFEVDSLKLSSTSSYLTGDYAFDYRNKNNVENTHWNNGPLVGGVDLNSGDAAGRSKEVTVTFPSGTMISSNDTLRFTILTLPPADGSPLTNLTLTVNYGGTQSKSLKLNNNVTTAKPEGDPISFPAFQKARIKCLALDGGSKWQLIIDGEVQPWIPYVDSTSFKSNIGIRNLVPGGYVVTNPLYIYEDENNNILRQTTPYYEGQPERDGFYYLNDGQYMRNGYYIRLTTKIAGVSDPCLTYQFTPTAPIGGYWQLSPEAVEGSLEYFRITVDDGINGESERLQGQVMGVPVTIYIRPTAEYLAMDNAPVCSCIIKCNMSPSITWDPLYSADSEFQSAHTDGTFSYNKFRIAK